MLRKRDSYRILRLNERSDSLDEAAVFSTLNASSDYWQVEINKTDPEKKAVKSHFGLCQFIRMNFELEHDPVTFQRAMNVILGP